MTKNTQATPFAQLLWDNNGCPRSLNFDDVYFSLTHGLEETRFVFLQHNRLQQRWQQLKQQSHPHFTIGETGFGTGLNFMAAWELWDLCAPARARLDFISVEKYPLRLDDLVKANSLWPELGDRPEQLAAHYPKILAEGYYRLCFDRQRVNLTLIIGDATEGLKDLLMSEEPMFLTQRPLVDAWFLDGFAPAKNPDMWNEDLFKTVASLSNAGASAATFTAASKVKQALSQAGFEVAKTPGFGTKREMISASFHGHSARKEALDNTEDLVQGRSRFTSPHPAPWQVNPQANTPQNHKRALIIGGGLGGCHTAHSLASRGWQVVLVEKHAKLAAEGSGNLQGALYAKLSHLPEKLASFNLAALVFAQQFYHPYWQQEEVAGEQCGVLQVAYNHKIEASLRATFDYFSQYVASGLNAGESQCNEFLAQEPFLHWLSNTEASEIAGVPLDKPGIWFPHSGWLNPASLCRSLCNHPDITLIHKVNIHRLVQDPQQQWLAIDENNQTVASAPVAIVAGANHSKLLEPCAELPLRAVRGQVSHCTSSPLSARLHTVLCAEGYLPPAFEGQHCLGATYDVHQADLELRASDHLKNLESLALLSPQLARNFQEQLHNNPPGKAALRCTTPDYLPIVGPVPQHQAFVERYGALRKNAGAYLPLPGIYWPNLYINVGHGSRGLAYTPLCAELLAAHINNEPPPLARELVLALHPGRFVIKDLIRNKL